MSFIQRFHHTSISSPGL